MKTIIVTTEDGERHEVTFRPLKVRQYPEAFAALNAKDEFKLIELAGNFTGTLKAINLTPESFDEAAQAMHEVSQRFFASFARQTMYAEMLGAIGNLVRNASAGASTSPGSGPARG